MFTTVSPHDSSKKYFISLVCAATLMATFAISPRRVDADGIRYPLTVYGLYAMPKDESGGEDYALPGYGAGLDWTLRLTDSVALASSGIFSMNRFNLATVNVTILSLSAGINF